MQNKSKLQSNSSTNLNGSLVTRSMMVPKKLEGSDQPFFERSNVQKHNTFAIKIEKIKNKPKVEAIEEQYIKGLQNEIAFIEMELKLLQEKEMQKHGQIDQLEQFFKDGIPINENILAIKNGFKSQQTSLQQRTAVLQAEKNERNILIQNLTQKNDLTSHTVTEKEKKLRQTYNQSHEQYLQLTKKEALLRHETQTEEDFIRQLKQENKKMTEQLERINRDKMINNISVLKSQNHKLTKLNQLRDSLKQKDAQLKLLTKQFDQLSKQQSQCSYLIRLQEMNLQLKKKTIFLQRDHDALKGKLKQCQLQLQQKKKERLTQIDLKLEVKERVDEIKQKIAHQNALSNEEIEQSAKEQQICTLHRIMQDNQRLAKYTDHYSKLLGTVEESIQQLLTRKPEVKAEIASYISEVERLNQQLKQQILQTRNQIGEKTSLGYEAVSLKQALTVLPDKIEKAEEQIKYFKEEKARLAQDIEVKQKQLQLIFIIKNINFDETQIAKSSSNNVQDELIGFLKSWEKIQKMK